VRGLSQQSPVPCTTETVCLGIGVSDLRPFITCKQVVFLPGRATRTTPNPISKSSRAPGASDDGGQDGPQVVTETTPPESFTSEYAGRPDDGVGGAVATAFGLLEPLEQPATEAASTTRPKVRR
jgi:hypothetical protein